MCQNQLISLSKMTNPVFLIPGLLSEILEQVDCVERPYWRPEERRCPRSLLRCQLVNSLWFNEASRIIWRVLCRFGHLGEVQDGHRRQLYVKMVRDFTLEHRSYRPGPFEFTRLKTVRISYQSNMDDVHSLLMATVEYFQFSSSRVRFNDFGTVDRRCPNIQSLSLQLGVHLSTELMESLKQYLAVTMARRVGLRRADFEYTPELDELLPVLAQNDNVRELSVVRIRQNAILHIMQSGNKQPFKHLKYFSGVGSVVILRDLLCIMPNVEYLVIDQLPLDQQQNEPALNLDVLLELASANLKRISMCTREYKAEKSRLLALANKFPLLESVQLYSLAPDSSDNDASEMLDDEFAHEFTRRLPNLKVIELDFDHGSLTAEGLISIAKNCPLLEVLNLVGERNPDFLDDGWRRMTWRKRSLFYYPIFSAEKESLFPRLVYFAPLVKMKHLPRWMQKYHFPIIFGELERKFGVTNDNQSCRAWFLKIRTRLLEM